MLPKDAIRKNDNHLAEGAHTGHFHAAVADSAAVYELPGQDVLVLDAPEGTPVTHQEHNVVEVPAGQHDVSRVLEYDHFAEEARVVRD